MGSREKIPAALGFSCHTGWAAMIAVSGGGAAVVLDRRRVEMLPGKGPEGPPFVYHAARRLSLDAAERLVGKSASDSLVRATAALEAAVDELGRRNYQAVASGIIVSDRSLKSSLDQILSSHALIHAAEGELFRGAVRGASKALKLPVVEVPSKDLYSRAAKVLRVPVGDLPERLASIGRTAGRPWAKDQKDSCLVALIALSGQGVE